MKKHGPKTLHRSASAYLATLTQYRRRLTGKDATNLAHSLSYAAHLASTTGKRVWLVQGDSYGHRVYVLGTQSAKETVRFAGRSHLSNVPVIEVTHMAGACMAYSLQVENDDTA